MKETIKSAAQWFAAELARQFTKSQFEFTKDITLARFHALRAVQRETQAKQVVGIAIAMGHKLDPMRVWGEVRELPPGGETRFVVPNPFGGDAVICGVEFMGSDLVLAGAFSGNLRLQEGAAPATPLVLQSFRNITVERGDAVSFFVQWRPNK